MTYRDWHETSYPYARIAAKWGVPYARVLQIVEDMEHVQRHPFDDTYHYSNFHKEDPRMLAELFTAMNHELIRREKTAS